MGRAAWQRQRESQRPSVLTRACRPALCTTPPPGGVQGANSASIRFLLDGDSINVTDTPDTLEMEDGDVIDVHQQQTGGSW